MRLNPSSLRLPLLSALLCAAPILAYADQPPAPNLNMAIDLALQENAVGEETHWQRG
jgi:hypothetical protein